MQITITEVGLRDGIQSERQFIPTEQKLRLIEAVFSAGIRAVEATSFVAPAAVPQLADADDLASRIQRPEGAVISALAPNARGVHRAIRAKVDEIVAFVSASPTHNSKNLNRSIDESLLAIQEVVDLANEGGVGVRGAIATAFGCPFEGEVNIPSVVDIAKALTRSGISRITLGDTTGMATPKVVMAVCSAIREALPEARLSLHFHNTRGLGLVNVSAGLSLGITEYESSLGGVGGCPFAPGATGNVCTEDLIHFLHEEGHSTGVDLDRLIEASMELERVLERPLPGQVMRSGPRLRLHSAENAPTARSRSH